MHSFVEEHFDSEEPHTAAKRERLVPLQVKSKSDTSSLHGKWRVGRGVSFGAYGKSSKVLLAVAALTVLLLWRLGSFLLRCLEVIGRGTRAGAPGLTPRSLGEFGGGDETANLCVQIFPQEDSPDEALPTSQELDAGEGLSAQGNGQDLEAPGSS